MLLIIILILNLSVYRNDLGLYSFLKILKNKRKAGLVICGWQFFM